MNITAATDMVLRAATAHANGHSNAGEILEAVAVVRAYMDDQDEAPAHTCVFGGDSPVCRICGA